MKWDITGRSFAQVMVAEREAPGEGARGWGNEGAIKRIQEELGEMWM